MGELNGKEAEFARLLAIGHSQSDAFRLSHDVKRMTDKTVHEKASRLAAKSEIKARKRELLQESRISDIESVGQAYQQLLEDMQAARDKDNHTALASYTRTKFGSQGMMKDHLTVAPEKFETDEQLIARLSGGDAHLATMLRAIIGKDTFGSDAERGDGEKDDEEK